MSAFVLCSQKMKRGWVTECTLVKFIRGSYRIKYEKNAQLTSVLYVTSLTQLCGNISKRTKDQENFSGVDVSHA